MNREKSAASRREFLKGAGRIIAVGSRPKTVELARRYGATDIIDYHDGDIAGQVRELLNVKRYRGILTTHALRRCRNHTIQNSLD